MFSDDGKIHVLIIFFFYSELFQGGLILRFLSVLAVYQTSLTVCSFGKCVWWNTQGL